MEVYFGNVEEIMIGGYDEEIVENGGLVVKKEEEFKEIEEIK